MIDFWIFPLSTIWGAYQKSRTSALFCLQKNNFVTVHTHRGIVVCEQSLNLSETVHKSSFDMSFANFLRILLNLFRIFILVYSTSL